MQSSELWAAWIVAAVLVGVVAWAGRVPGQALTPASDVARRAPISIIRPPAEADELLPAMQRIAPGEPVPAPTRRREPASGGPRQVYLCVIDGPRQGAC
jgi:hypothetical protein